MEIRSNDIAMAILVCNDFEQFQFSGFSQRDSK
jgi:hypothetical protein